MTTFLRKRFVFSMFLRCVIVCVTADMEFGLDDDILLAEIIKVNKLIRFREF